LPYKLRPPCIRDRFGEAVVFLHVPHSQRLDGDHLIFVDQSGTELMQEILAGIGDVRMQTSDFTPSLLSVG